MDTTRFDRLGCYGYAEAETPNLDKLAARGARFEQAIAPVALTRPSHATMLTGKLPQSHGVWSNGPYRLDPVHKTLPTYLRDAGYRTAGVVASFVLNRSFGLEQGIELFDDATDDIEDGDPEKTAPEVVEVVSTSLATSLRPPFFLWTHFYDPHLPYTPPSPFAERFEDRPYDGEIAAMDHAIGQILDLLDARGWLAETLVVAVSDHGEGLGERGETSHGYFLYDNTLRVPLILAGPGVPKGLVVANQVTLADLTPTLLEAFGLKPDATQMDGRSLWNELRAGAVTPRPALIENRAIEHQYGWFPISGLRSAGWKWIWAPQPELYDLTSDAAESLNLVASHRERAAELRRQWRQLRREVPEAQAQTRGLSPEEERKLSSLGYLAAAPSSSPVVDPVDPKSVAGAIRGIEALASARRSQRTEETEGLLREVLRLDPSNLFALRIQGEMLVARGRHREAAEILETITSGHETHPEALALLASAYENTGRLEDALRLYQQATTPPWIYWPALESLARTARIQPDRLPREALLRKLEGLQPLSGRERLSLARAFAIARELPRSEHWFERALEADPDLVEARVGLAQTQSGQGRHEEALRTLTAITSPTVESVYVTGTVRRALGEETAACGAFRDAWRRGPENANLLLGLGAHLQRCGDIELARQALERVRDSEPRRFEALFQLARLEESQGRIAEARALYERFVQGAPARLEEQRAAALIRLRAIGG